MAHADGRSPGRPRPERTRAAAVVAIATGGALGASARYGVSEHVHIAPGTFPWATFWVNVAGSLVLGFLVVLLVDRFPSTRYVRPFFATGFLGAFTTFSTFTVETDLLLRDGHAAMATAYVAASLVGGLVAAGAGIALGRQAAPEPATPDIR